MSDWKPGDLAVCVDASPPDYPGLSRRLNRGRVYRITDIVPSPVGSGYGVLCDGEPPFQLPRGPRGWRPNRFRKLNDGTDDAKLIARIKQCRPARIPEIARVPIEPEPAEFVLNASLEEWIARMESKYGPDFETRDWSLNGEGRE